MSNKPLKISEQKRLQEKMKKKQRIVEARIQFPPYMYIVSEGTKTEPNYINGLVNKINSWCKKYSRGDRIKVYGTGCNTVGLLEFARKQVDEEFPQATEVWLVYDKDDFPYDNFDNTEFSAQGREDIREYRVAWSNESIELWFLLHFQELSANVGREQYLKLLNKHLEQNGYAKYDKNDKDIYKKLADKTEIAIARAKKQYNSYNQEPPSRRCPATRVFELVEELEKYL